MRHVCRHPTDMSAHIPLVRVGDAGITSIVTPGKRYGLFERKAHASGPKRARCRGHWRSLECHIWQSLSVLKRYLDLQFAKQIVIACRTSSCAGSGGARRWLRSQCHQGFRAFASVSQKPGIYDRGYMTRTTERPQ